MTKQFFCLSESDGGNRCLTICELCKHPEMQNQPIAGSQWQAKQPTPEKDWVKRYDQLRRDNNMSDAPKGDDVKELQDDPFIKKHLAIIREKTIDNIIEIDIARKMFGGLEMASVQHFLESGTISGSLYLRLKEAMLKAYNWNDKAAKEYASQFAAPQAVKWLQAKAFEALVISVEGWQLISDNGNLKVLYDTFNETLQSILDKGSADKNETTQS